jgi:hypothetical protein
MNFGVGHGMESGSGSGQWTFNELVPALLMSLYLILHLKVEPDTSYYDLTVFYIFMWKWNL